MKIERSRATRADAKKVPGGLRHIFCFLLLVAAVVAAVGAVASPRANQGLGGVNNASPGGIILVTNTSDSGPGSLRDALAVAREGDTIDATGVSGTILLTSGELQIFTPGVTSMVPVPERWRSTATPLSASLKISPGMSPSPVSQSPTALVMAVAASSTPAPIATWRR